MNYLIIVLLLIIVICLFTSCGIVPYATFHEQFLSLSKSETTQDNLLTNSSFQHGHNVGQLFYKTPKLNNVVQMDNPGSSPYVLQQITDVTSDGKYNSYILKVKLELGENYLFSFWGTSGSAQKDIPVYFKQNYDNKCESDESLNVKYRKNGSKKVGNMVWDKHEYQFYIPTNLSYEVYIYIGCYNTKDSKGSRYVTELTLQPHLPNAPQFPVTLGLQTFLDANNTKSYDGNSQVWNDLSNNHLNYTWKYKPDWNQAGFFKSNDNTLTGPLFNYLKTSKNNYQKFSIVIYSQSNKVLTDTDVYEDKPVALDSESGKMMNLEDKSPVLTLHIPGNQKTAFSIMIPNKPDNLKMIIGDKLFVSNNPVNPQTKSMYTFTYKNIDHTKNELEIWINDVHFQTFHNVPYIYFRDNLIMNMNTNWNANLYSILIYNLKLSYGEISQVYKYLSDPTRKPITSGSNFQPLEPSGDKKLHKLEPQPLQPLQPMNPEEEELMPLEEEHKALPLHKKGLIPLEEQEESVLNLDNFYKSLMDLDKMIEKRKRRQCKIERRRERHQERVCHGRDCDCDGDCPEHGNGCGEKCPSRDCIEKDKVPCWGCNLENSSTQFDSNGEDSWNREWSRTWDNYQG